MAEMKLVGFAKTLGEFSGEIKDISFYLMNMVL
jgi:hypothetical protein